MSKKVIVGAVLGVLVVAFIAFMVIKPVTVFGVTGKGLARSIDGELASQPQAPIGLECTEQSEGIWQCTGERFGTLDVLSGVNVDDGGCWEIVGGFQGAFRGRTGCISVFDATGAF